MNSISQTQKFFTEFDMFSAPPILRARKQPDTSSYTSGILSFLLGIFFLYVFVSKITSVVMYQQITSVQTESKLSPAQLKADNVFFGVNVGYMGVNQSLTLFDIELMTTSDDGSDISIPLEQCRQQQWAGLGDDYKEQFDQYKLGKFFCPTSLDYLRIRKTYYDPNSIYLRIQVRPCTKGAYCNKNMTQQLEKVKQYQSIEGCIFMVVYFLDSLISPSQKNVIKRTMNTDPEIAFTMKRSVIGTIQLASFKVTTDIGYFPVNQLQTIEGNLVSSFRETSYEIVDQTTPYSLVYITMNRKVLLIDRTVGKFDEMLSYAGGLFSIIVGFLKIFMYSYNEYRYELMVAEGICQNDQDGNKIRQKDFNFWKYIKYTIFDWIQVLCCHQIDWMDCKLIDMARQQANSILDVTNLFKKIKGFENAFQHLLDQNERDCLFLVKPTSLDQSKRDRLILEYYSIIMKDDPAMTIREYFNAKSIFNFAIKIHQKSIFTSKSLRRQVSNSFYQGANEFPEDMKNITKESYTTEQILQLFPDMAQSALNIKLDKEMEEVEIQLVEAYFRLKPEQVKKIQQQIPIKILIRLRAKRLQLAREESQLSSFSMISSLKM